jgi:hypothetical protein
MPEVSKSVAFPDGLFDFLYRARIHHQSHPAALSANQVIIMLSRIQQLEVATRPVQMNPLRNVLLLQHCHHAEDSGIVRGDAFSYGAMLNLVE